MSEAWIGAEVRAHRKDEWSAHRRAQYLLLREVDLPLSVDRAVWPVATEGTLLAYSVVVARPGDADAFVPAPNVEGVALLGFDVADGALTSGLSNCGYRSGEVDAARAAWASRLNGHHLFGAVEDAIAFRTFSELRVPEHAPFFVFGLYAKAGALG